MNKCKLLKSLVLPSLVFTIFTIGTSPSWAIVVTTVTDSGPGSLRAAITSANADGAANVITFDPVVSPAPPALPGIILLASQLPVLSDTGDMIDATGVGVAIDGSALSGNEIGLQIRRNREKNEFAN